MKRISLFILRPERSLTSWFPLYSISCKTFGFSKTLQPLHQQVLERPLRKGTSHRTFSLTGRCSTFLSGCVLPEVMVLILIQWNSLQTNRHTLVYGQNQNHVYLWLHSGTPEGQGNTQFNLKGSEGCDGNHQDPLSKDNLIPARH